MSVHPIQREPDLPFIHDARTVFAHLRQQGVPASEALRLVRKRFPPDEGTEATESHLTDEIADLRAQKHTVDQRIAGLERDLTHARDRIQALERDLAQASVRTGNALYRRVGLDEGCPDFVLKAARRAYRTALHPDGHPPERKAEAERRFKDAEAVFEQIFAVRGLR